MEKGEILSEVVIEDLSHDGRGVGRVQGYAIFIPGALIGERVQIVMEKTNRRYGEGRLQAILHPSPERVQPPCPVFPACGGCQLQHLSYRGQLAFKEKRVLEALKRLGQLNSTPIKEVFSPSEIWQYRNKGVYHVQGHGSHIRVGFFEQASHKVIPHDQCLLQPPLNNELKRRLAGLWTGGKLVGGKGFTLRNSFESGEQIVLLHGPLKKRGSWKALAESLALGHPSCRGLYIWEQGREGVKHVWGQTTLKETMGGMTFQLSPHTFFQTNPQAREILFDRVRLHLNLSDHDTLLDLYSGVGAFSIPLAQEVKRVVGIEVSPQAIRDGSRMVRSLGYDHVEFHQGLVEKNLHLVKKMAPSKILLDPPRQGCHKDVLAALRDSDVQKVIYVSCNPASLARDVKELMKGGFSVGALEVVDMFPHTYHVECAVVLERDKPLMVSVLRV